MVFLLDRKAGTPGRTPAQRGKAFSCEPLRGPPMGTGGSVILAGTVQDPRVSRTQQSGNPPGARCLLQGEKQGACYRQQAAMGWSVLTSSSQCPRAEAPSAADFQLQMGVRWVRSWDRRATAPQPLVFPPDRRHK